MMQRAASLVVIALAAAMLLSSRALAVGIFFDVVATTPINENTATDNSQCPEPCYQVRVFVQDYIGSTTRILAVQFNIKVEGATLVNLFHPGGPNPKPTSNSSGGNVTITGADPSFTLRGAPWNLSSTVADSPIEGFYALAVHASDFFWSVQSLQTLRSDPDHLCSPASTCDVQSEGLAAGRIFAGRFNLSGVSAATTFHVAGVEGLGELVTGPGLPGYYLDRISYLMQLNLAPHPHHTDPSTCSLGASFRPNATIGTSAGQCLAGSPEPAAVLLLGAAIAGVSVVRRRAVERLSVDA